MGRKRGSVHQLVTEVSDVLLTDLQQYLPPNSFSLKLFLYCSLTFTWNLSSSNHGYVTIGAIENSKAAEDNYYAVYVS